MAEHKAGSAVLLSGTIVAIAGDVAVVKLDRAFPPGGQVTVMLDGVALAGGALSEEDRIRDLMTEARDHPGRVITR